MYIYVYTVFPPLREHRSRGGERHAEYVCRRKQDGRPSESRWRHKAPSTGWEDSAEDPHRNTHTPPTPRVTGPVG